MSEIVKVVDLSKNFGSFSAVNHLSFSVDQGQVYGFLGQNGAGKSTTIRMLVSLIAPTDGSIQLFGMDLKTHRREILRNIGAVIEKPAVYSYLSAYDNLSIFARLSGIKVSKKLLMDQLEMVGLSERATDKVKHFSQGMKQRMGIAIALVHNPSLVILDEPTNGLDPQGIADIRNLILQLSHVYQKTIVVSSHLLSEIEQMATKVLIIDKGKKIVEGLSTELFDPTETMVEIEAVNNAAAIEKLLNSNWKQTLVPHSSPNGKFILKLDKSIIPQLHKDLVAMDIALISFQSRHKLEDYFLQVTSGKQHVDTFTDRNL